MGISRWKLVLMQMQVDGVAENEWIFVDGKWYYAESDGRIAQGKTLRINNVYYTFDDNGVWIR